MSWLAIFGQAYGVSRYIFLIVWQYLMASHGLSSVNGIGLTVNGLYLYSRDSPNIQNLKHFFNLEKYIKGILFQTSVSCA